MSPRPALVLPLLGLILIGSIAATISDLNEAGKVAYARGDYAAAEHLFNQALAQAPDEPLLHYHLGVVFMRLSRWREASTAFETTLRLNPPRNVAAAAREGLRSLAPLLREPAARGLLSDDDAVSLRRVGGNWVARVSVNGSRTARFLVDTGASTCVISPDLASALGIEPDREAPPVLLQTVSGVTSGRAVRIPSLRVGDAEAEDVIAVIHPVGASMDGILGNTFLSRFTVTLDPERGRLRLSPR